MSFPERYIVAPLTEKLYQKAEKNKSALFHDVQPGYKIPADPRHS